MLNGVGLHLLQIIKFRFAIAIEVINAIINDPKRVGMWIDINASNHSDAFDEAVSVAIVLASHKFNAEGMTLI